VPIALRSITSAKGTFAPHVPVIVKLLDTGKVKEDWGVRQEPPTPDIAFALDVVRVPWSVKVLPVIWPLLISPIILGTPNELYSTNVPVGSIIASVPKTEEEEEEAWKLRKEKIGACRLVPAHRYETKPLVALPWIIKGFWPGTERNGISVVAANDGTIFGKVIRLFERIVAGGNVGIRSWEIPIWVLILFGNEATNNGETWAPAKELNNLPSATDGINTSPKRIEAVIATAGLAKTLLLNWVVVLLV
jgi:hypothetical protein